MVRWQKKVKKFFRARNKKLKTKTEDIALGFKDGLGGIVNASRSLMCAYKSDRWKDTYSDSEYAQATRAEAIRMRDELNSAIK